MNISFPMYINKYTNTYIKRACTNCYSCNSSIFVISVSDSLNYINIQCYICKYHIDNYFNNYDNNKMLIESNKNNLISLSNI